MALSGVSSAGPHAASARRRILNTLGGILRTAMRLFPRALVLSLLVSCLALEARAQGYSPAAERVVARARAAAGGAAWYRLRGWRERGRQGGAAYERWIDPVRYGLRVETRAGEGLHVDGFNGQAVWQILPDGMTTAVNDHPALAQARTTAFFGADCFFYPGRFDVRGDYKGVRRSRGREYEVVEVQPWGGHARELWFDSRSHLLGRIVDRTGPRPQTLAVSDYRRVGPVLIAFRYTPEPGASTGAAARQIDSVVLAPVDRELFSLEQPALISKARPAPASDPVQRPAMAPPSPSSRP